MSNKPYMIMLARLICHGNIMTVFYMRKISYVSDEEIHWLGLHIAAAKADVVLAVENNKILHHPYRTSLRTQDCSATVFF